MIELLKEGLWHLGNFTHPPMDKVNVWSDGLIRDGIKALLRDLSIPSEMEIGVRYPSFRPSRDATDWHQDCGYTSRATHMHIIGWANVYPTELRLYGAWEAIDPPLNAEGVYMWNNTLYEHRYPSTYNISDDSRWFVRSYIYKRTIDELIKKGTLPCQQKTLNS